MGQCSVGWKCGTSDAGVDILQFYTAKIGGNFKTSIFMGYLTPRENYTPRGLHIIKMTQKTGATTLKLHAAPPEKLLWIHHWYDICAPMYFATLKQHLRLLMVFANLEPNFIKTQHEMHSLPFLKVKFNCSEWPQNKIERCIGK